LLKIYVETLDEVNSTLDHFLGAMTYGAEVTRSEARNYVARDVALTWTELNALKFEFTSSRI
jgi:hypothetical protein